MAKGKPQEKAAAKPAKQLCGARTRTCLGCGHHQKQHAKGGGACSCGCRKFDPKLCTSDKLMAGGKSKRSKPRCQLHGGKTPVGVASANWRHGLRSAYMPTALENDYHEALHDPQLTNIREDLALVELQVKQILLGYRGKPGAKPKPFSLTDRKELQALADLRARLIGSEARRIRDLALAVPVERVRAMGTSLVTATRETLMKLHQEGHLKLDPNVALRDIQATWLKLQGMNRLQPAANHGTDAPTSQAS
jgi:hypothetical protein